MTEAPALGDPTLDADHAKLADLVDRLAAAKGADVLASLDALGVDHTIVNREGGALALGHPYCLVYPPAKARKAGLIDLVNWLKSAPTETGPAVAGRSR